MEKTLDKNAWKWTTTTTNPKWSDKAKAMKKEERKRSNSLFWRKHKCTHGEKSTVWPEKVRCWKIVGRCTSSWFTQNFGRHISYTPICTQFITNSLSARFDSVDHGFLISHIEWMVDHCCAGSDLLVASPQIGKSCLNIKMFMDLTPLRTKCKAHLSTSTPLLTVLWPISMHTLTAFHKERVEDTVF